MLDGQKLAALVASKVCHDMVEPMNALITGLEMLKQDTATSARAGDAIRLLEHGVNKAWAKLDFFRSAMAGGLGSEGDAQLEEVRTTLTRLYENSKPTLVWRAPGVILPRTALKVFLNLAFIASETLPKGGEVALEANAAGPSLTLTATGPRAKLKPETAQVLAGKEPEHGWQGSNVQPMLTRLLAEQAGVTLLVEEAPQRVRLGVATPALRIESRAA